jgi:hypothetical protein
MNRSPRVVLLLPEVRLFQARFCWPAIPLSTLALLWRRMPTLLLASRSRLCPTPLRDRPSDDLSQRLRFERTDDERRTFCDRGRPSAWRTCGCELEVQLWRCVPRIDDRATHHGRHGSRQARLPRPLCGGSSVTMQILTNTFDSDPAPAGQITTNTPWPDLPLFVLEALFPTRTAGVPFGPDRRYCRIESTHRSGVCK